MKKDKLLDYLRIVLQVESELYSLRESKAEYEHTVSSLGKPVKISRRQIFQPESHTIGLHIPFGVLCWMAIITLGISVVSCIASGRNEIGYHFGNMISLFAILLVVYLLYNLAAVLIRKTKKDRLYEAADLEYQDALEMDAERVNNELSIASHIISKGLDPTVSKIAQLEATLNKLYDMNVLHSSYRDMLAVAQILEYMESGICDQLEGPDGAYAQYRNDLRAQQIVSSVNDLKEAMSEKLDSVLRNQQAMCNLLRANNVILTGIRASLDNIGSKLDSIHSTISSMHEQQCTANEYLESINGQLKNASRHYDRAAVELSTMNANKRISMINDGISSFRIKYPA